MAPFEPPGMRELPQSNGETAPAARLHVARAAEIDVDAARTALADLAWLGQPSGQPSDQPGVRRIAADLELPIFDGSASGPVRKAAIVDLGLPRARNGDLILTVAWHSATHAPLFPVFAGELRIARDGVVLAGRYVPPFGRLGLLIDAALLHFVARRTAQAFLDRVATRLAPESV